MTYSDKLKDPRWQKRRLEILQRDDFSCQLCGDTTSTLAIHHLKYKGNPWDIEDEFLVTYCEHCHAAVEYNKFSKVTPIRTIKSLLFGGGFRICFVYEDSFSDISVDIFSYADGKIEYETSLSDKLVKQLFGKLYPNHVKRST